MTRLSMWRGGCIDARYIYYTCFVEFILACSITYYAIYTAVYTINNDIIDKQQIWKYSIKTKIGIVLGSSFFCFLGIFAIVLGGMGLYLGIRLIAGIT